MEILDGAVVGTAEEWRRVADIATHDDHSNRNDSTVAVIVTPRGWGVAAIDNRIATVRGKDSFRIELRGSIATVVSLLSKECEPKIIYRGECNK